MATALQKLKTLLRGQARVGMEQIINANDMLLLDQQLHETEQSLQDARRQLARLMAEKTLNGKRRGELEQQIVHYEHCARQALEQQEQALALETGERIAELEDQCAALGQQGETLAQQEKEFRDFIQQAADQLKSLRHEQALARTGEVLYGKGARHQGRTLGLMEKLADSQHTLEQIQQRQEVNRLVWHSEQHTGAMGSDCLQQKLAAAGIDDGRQQRARAILERLQK